VSAVRIALDVSFAKLIGIGVGVYASQLWNALAPLLGERLVPIFSRFARPPRGARRTVGERIDTVMRDLWWHQAGVTLAERRCCICRPGSDRSRDDSPSSQLSTT